jgi:Flp pilus assembly protein TadD
MIVATASPARTALKNSQLTCGERHAYFGDRTLGSSAYRPNRTKLKMRSWSSPFSSSIPPLLWILTSCFLAGAESEQPALPALSDDAKRAVERGIMEFHDQKFQDAKAEFQKITELAPAHPIGWLNLGSTEFRLGELDRAEAHLKKAVQLEPSAQQGWLTLGIIYYQRNELVAGMAALSQAVYLNPKDPKAHLYLGILIRKRGWLSGAEDEMRKAVELDETYAEAHFNLAVLYLEREPPALELARRHYYRALELGAEPDSEVAKTLQKAAKDDAAE